MAAEGVTIIGGHASQDYADGDEGIFTEDQIYLFAIDGLWPDTGGIAIAHVIAGELQFSVQCVISTDNLTMQTKQTRH